VGVRTLTDEDYQRLLALRHGLRRFLRWSEEQAERSGLTSAQHQLLLAIRGHKGELQPTVGMVAEALLLRHHSAVELVDRAEAMGLVRRRRDRTDQRVVRLSLTPRGRRSLAALTELHLEELARLSRSLRPLLEGLELAGSPADALRPADDLSTAPRQSSAEPAST
jgi:DNA-binding MarR family transcriptional regulator